VSDYGQDALDADAAFRDDGQLIAFTFKQPGGYVGGKVTAGTPILQSAWGIEIAVTARDLGIGTQAGTLIQAGDRKLLVSALADDGQPLTAPRVDDLAVAGGVTYTLKNIDKLSPGGPVVMWTLVGRI
jgi:hypothetical protein